MLTFPRLLRTRQGCDASVLLDDTITLHGKKKRPINKHALKGFGVIDSIKNQLESDCPRIVSCADILTIAARDATILVGGPYWEVPLGRKDSLSAGYELADEYLPGANEGLLTIMSKFLYQGLSVTYMGLIRLAWHGLQLQEENLRIVDNLGNITNPETFINGQVGRNCRFVNT